MYRNFDLLQRKKIQLLLFDIKQLRMYIFAFFFFLKSRMFLILVSFRRYVEFHPMSKYYYFAPMCVRPFHIRDRHANNMI